MPGPEDADDADGGDADGTDADDLDGDADPEIPVVCPECDTRTRVALAEVAASVERHNEQLHDGEEGARIDPELVAEIADLAAADLAELS